MTEINAAARQAASLTQQLLAFSRQQVMVPTVLNLNNVIGDLNRMLQRLIGEHVEISIHLSEGLHSVKADQSQIEQVIVNLAVNARDAMPGGGRLTIETANVDLDESYANTHPEVTPGPYVMLAVSDTGTGIDERIRAHIFDPFFTTKEIGKGTGLDSRPCTASSNKAVDTSGFIPSRAAAQASKSIFPRWIAMRNRMESVTTHHAKGRR